MSETSSSDLLARLTAALGSSYRIDRVLGQGGMGVVVLATDLTLERHVAIKVISPEVGTGVELRQRFAQEAKTVARLRHPNIVAVYSAGEADGLLYFVMEFVPGESLRDRLTRERRVAPYDARAIVRDLALALDYAHTAGVVHRDVKPENVLLDRESGRAMLTDFGVAQAFAGDTRLTGAGFVLGSPRYMSPEQAAGESQLDGRSDLYSLGLIGYEMLSGEPAIDAPTAASTLVKQITEIPAPIADKSPDTPAAVAATIDRLLAKSPDDRLQRGNAVAAAVMGEAMDDHASSGPVPRASGAPRARAVPQTRSSRLVVGIAAGAITAAAAGALLLSSRGSAVNDKEWLIAPFEVQGPDRSLDWLREGGLNVLTLSLARWNDLHVVEYERTLDLLRDADLDNEKRVGLDDARAVARRAGAGRVVLGQVTTLGDSVVITASLYDVASGTSIEKARVEGAMSADPRALFETVATQLLDLVGAPKLSSDLTTQTTTSVAAYREYLTGLNHLNRWRLLPADSAFDRAIAADSTFALAYYKKSVALGWGLRDDSARSDAAAKAVRYSERLAPRLQELIRGHQELTAGFTKMASGDTTARLSFLASRTRLARLVAEDSMDAEAAYALADVNFHLVLNTSYGQSFDSSTKYLSESLRGFHRTIALDSSFHLAYQHLVELYNMSSSDRATLVLEGDSLRAGGSDANERKVGSIDYVAQLRTQAREKARVMANGWINTDPDAASARRVLALNFAQAGEIDSALAVYDEALRRPATATAPIAFERVFLRAREGLPNAGRDLQALLTRYTTDSVRTYGIGDRLPGLFGSMSVAGMVGMPSVLALATERLETSTPLIPGGGGVPMSSLTLWYGAAMRTAMGIPISPPVRQRLMGAIRALETSGGNFRDPAIPYILFVGSRDTIFAKAAMRWARDASYPELEGLLALRRGDSATAQRIARTFPSADSIRKSRLGMQGTRVVARAELLAQLGDTRRAAELYEAIEPTRFSQRESLEAGWGIYVRSLLSQARLFEQVGERTKAIAAYERFAAMWADAEAPMQADVREARAAAARLRESSAVPVRGASAPKG